MWRKLFFVCVALSICFIVACGKASNKGTGGSPTGQGGTDPGDGGGDPGQLPPTKICYPGKLQDNTACVPLRDIDAATLGYRDPYTDPQFPAGQKKDQYRKPLRAIDLPKVDLSLSVEPNFILSEFLSLKKGDFGLLSKVMLDIVQKMRSAAKIALKINSGFRPPLYNEGVDGSAKWSRHQYGDAVDIASNGVSLDKLADLCRSAGANFISKYVVHVHCDWRNQPLNTEFFGEQPKDKNDLDVEETDEQQIIMSMYQGSQIVVAGDLKAGNVIQLSSNVEFKDDGDDLYKKWTIIAPDGRQAVIESQTVSLKVQKGTYQVIHDIGGNIQLNKSIFVN